MYIDFTAVQPETTAVKCYVGKMRLMVNQIHCIKVYEVFLPGGGEPIDKAVIFCTTGNAYYTDEDYDVILRLHRKACRMKVSTL